MASEWDTSSSRRRNTFASQRVSPWTTLIVFPCQSERDDSIDLLEFFSLVIGMVEATTLFQLAGGHRSL